MVFGVVWLEVFVDGCFVDVVVDCCLCCLFFFYVFFEFLLGDVIVEFVLVLVCWICGFGFWFVCCGLCEDYLC